MNYHYTECGLDNVQLENVAVITDDDDEEVCEISNIVGLHRVIAACIIHHSRGISPKELRFLRTEMGMTQAELAEIVKKDHQTVGRWERGETMIDPNAEAVIRLLATERLKLDRAESVEELARHCVPAAEVQVITIDAGDPRHYRPLEAA
jgi:DNA-binding transcriptional regulator YiaG